MTLHTKPVIDDVRIREIKELVPPVHVFREYPASNRAAQTTYAARQGIHRCAVTVVTQVLVDADDPAFQNPTKPIGQKDLVALVLLVSAAGAGILLTALSWFATYLPSPYRQSEFWTSSPTFYFMRIGIMMLLLALIYVWVQRPFSSTPLQGSRGLMLTFGRSSLFVYWIHVELAYGVFSRPLQRALPFWWAVVGYALFTAAMYAVTLLKNRLVDWWKTKRDQPLSPQVA